MEKGGRLFDVRTIYFEQKSKELILRENEEAWRRGGGLTNTSLKFVFYA